MTCILGVTAGIAAFLIGFLCGAFPRAPQPVEKKRVSPQKEAENLRQWNNFLHYDGSEQTE